MEVINLELNKEYKYPMLCKIFGEPKKTGKAKQLQIANWKRFYDITIGQKATFIILEIYNMPKTKVDGRGKSKGSRNNYKGIYAEYIDRLLLQYLQEEENKLKDTCKIYTTNNKIAENTGIVNHNYRVAFSNREKFYNTVKKDFNIKSNTYCMKDVFDMTKTKIREIVKASLERLQKAEKLEYETCYFIYIAHTSKVPNVEEMEAISLAEEMVMEEMSVTTKKEIDNNYKLSKEFNRKVLEKVQEGFDYIDGIYKGYTISLWDDFELKNDEEIKELKVKLNALVIKSLKEKPPKIQEKTIKDEKLELWFGARSPFWSRWVFDRLSKKYIEHCFDFIHILVDIEAENITMKIKNCRDKKVPDGLTHKQKEEQKDKIIIQLIDRMNTEELPY